MPEIRITVSNSSGLHTRPCTAISRLANQYKSELFIGTSSENQVNAKSPLSLLTLGAKQGTVLYIHAQGKDEQLLLNAIKKLFNNNFNSKT